MSELGMYINLLSLVSILILPPPRNVDGQRFFFFLRTFYFNWLLWIKKKKMKEIEGRLEYERSRGRCPLFIISIISRSQHINISCLLFNQSTMFRKKKKLLCVCRAFSLPYAEHRWYSHIFPSHIIRLTDKLNRRRISSGEERKIYVYIYIFFWFWSMFFVTNVKWKMCSSCVCILCLGRHIAYKK